MPTIAKKISHADRTRLWWVDAVRQLHDLADERDRIEQEAGQGGCPFTLAQLRTIEVGIGRALDAVAETVPVAA